ncbi:hypothetical protein GS399_12875 [Pedobacter sp. HMF7647]|uniref:Carbohydrate-binding domain-containing protein n=1 Tax=Hufsiella arboris TaxID=2695275 RepID=A0A7K1YBX7_9SPHI|nr:carbohydrate-binding family 9-like protein [Hufsiella arboris]MXV51871.1 hypothetical protein [Hufsiella arboris]
MINRLGLIIAFVISLSQQSVAQNTFDAFKSLFTDPKSYIIRQTTAALKIDGSLDENSWASAAWTDDFVDIEGSSKPIPALKTRVKMLWNDSTLFVAAKLDEPDIWAYQKKHDDIIFHDNDFEIFISPQGGSHQYFEIEINALNKIFDLYLPKPYRNGGDALVSWDVKGLQSAVSIDGKLNDASGKDRSWTVEMAIPFNSIKMGFSTTIPKEGTIWRINFSRVEWDTAYKNGKYVKATDAAGKTSPEHNWVWSPQGVINMHYPERWGYIQFTKKQSDVFKLPFAEELKKRLWLIYYSQKRFQQSNGRYAASLEDLQIASVEEIGLQKVKLTLNATGRQFTADVSAVDGESFMINDEGLITSIKK